MLPDNFFKNLFSIKNAQKNDAENKKRIIQFCSILEKLDTKI
jgi:hypothetical protein